MLQDIGLDKLNLFGGAAVIDFWISDLFDLSVGQVPACFFIFKHRLLERFVLIKGIHGDAANQDVGCDLLAGFMPAGFLLAQE